MSKLDERLNVPVSADLLERIDAYRARLRPIPTRAETVRQLVESALGGDEPSSSSDPESDGEDGESPAGPAKEVRSLGEIVFDLPMSTLELAVAQAKVPRRLAALPIEVGEALAAMKSELDRRRAILDKVDEPYDF